MTLLSPPPPLLLFGSTLFFSLPCSLQPQALFSETLSQGGEFPWGEPSWEGGGAREPQGCPTAPSPPPSPAGSCSRASAAPHCYAPHIPSPGRAAARQELGLQQQLGVAGVASLLVQAAGSILSPLKTLHSPGPWPGWAPPSSCSIFCLLAPSNLPLSASSSPSRLPPALPWVSSNPGHPIVHTGTQKGGAENEAAERH